MLSLPLPLMPKELKTYALAYEIKEMETAALLILRLTPRFVYPYSERSTKLDSQASYTLVRLVSRLRLAL
jgi:hypothetical protein